MFKFYDFIRDMGLKLSELLPQNAPLSTQYQYSNNRYQLEDSARRRISEYLGSTVLKRLQFGESRESQAVIAFSFGDSDTLNEHLAQEVSAVYQENPKVGLYLQQEIAKHIIDEPYTAISNRDYQTTTDVAQVVLDEIGKVKITVIAQAWHAQRCIDTCESLGFEVVALRVVDGFPSEDPQPWVRNPINWIIKESHREVATGYEVSKRFNLI